MNDELSSYLSPASLISTWTMTVSPELSLRRVVEAVTMAEASVERHVTMELTVATADRLLIPILRPRRGLLVDNLHVDPSQLGSVYTLNRQETVTMTIQLIRSIVLWTLMKSRKRTKTPGAKRAIETFCRLPAESPRKGLRLMRAMRGIQTLPVRRRRLKALGEFGDFILCLRALANDNQFLDLMEFFRTHRLVLMPFSPSDNGHQISFTYETLLQEVVPGGFYNAVRSSLGHAPYDLRFEIPLAIRTPSYHFRLRAPTGQFIRLQEILVPRFSVQSRLNPQSWELMRLRLRPGQGFIEGDHPTSTNFAHLYLGNVHLGTPIPRRMFARVTINERPLGEMARAFLKVSLSFGILFSVALFGSNLVHRGSGSGDVIAILVILPGLLGYVGPSGATIGSVSVSPISARIGSTLATYCSLIGAVLVLSWATSGKMGGPAFAMPTGVFYGYVAILSVQMWVMLWLAYRICVGVNRYRKAHAFETGSRQ